MKKLALLTLMLLLTSALVLGCTEPASAPAPATPAAPVVSKPPVPEFEPQGGEYGKYFVRGPKPSLWNQPTETQVVELDGAIVPDSMFFSYSFQQPGYGSWGAHGPHQHPCWEILGFFSTDPDDPYNLDAEIVFYVGEEMEPHTITQSTLVYVPPDTPHCPLVYERMGRPIVFLYGMSSPQVVEKSRHDLVELVPEKHRAGLFWPYEMGFPMMQQPTKTDTAK
jgi:hypothetical protein